jgi:predicted membrane protein
MTDDTKEKILNWITKIIANLIFWAVALAVCFGIFYCIHKTVVLTGELTNQPEMNCSSTVKKTVKTTEKKQSILETLKIRSNRLKSIDIIVQKLKSRGDSSDVECL